MKKINFDQVTYKLNGVTIAPGDLKRYYYMKIEVKMYINDQFIGYTDIDD